jgi:hypothetical protein
MIAKILSSFGYIKKEDKKERDDDGIPTGVIPVATVLVKCGNTYTSWMAINRVDDRRIPDGEHTLYIKEEFAPR